MFCTIISLSVIILSQINFPFLVNMNTHIGYEAMKELKKEKISFYTLSEFNSVELLGKYFIKIKACHLSPNQEDVIKLSSLHIYISNIWEARLSLRIETGRNSSSFYIDFNIDFNFRCWLQCGVITILIF